jgi:hypothetical protein
MKNFPFSIIINNKVNHNQIQHTNPKANSAHKHTESTLLPGEHKKKKSPSRLKAGGASSFLRLLCLELEPDSESDNKGTQNIVNFVGMGIGPEEVARTSGSIIVIATPILAGRVEDDAFVENVERVGHDVSLAAVSDSDHLL